LGQNSFGLSIKILPILPIVFSRYKSSLPIRLKILVTSLVETNKKQLEKILMSDVSKNVKPDLKTLQDNMNELETRFDKLREDVISKLKDCSDCIKSAKQLCHEATEMSTDLENKLANASNEEKEWKDIKAKLATTSIKGKIILDVGGEKFTTSVDTLTRVKDTFFTALFSKQWELERDPDDKSIFIDRNGKIFTYILEYLRTDMVPNRERKRTEPNRTKTVRFGSSQTDPNPNRHFEK